jgi:uncharacterized protein YkwD
MPYRPASLPVEPLEPRRLFTAVAPSGLEQYVVELINRARANPTAEASRHGIALNEGLPAGTISTAPKQPLAINPYLTDGARDHSQWMIDADVFSHTGSGGSLPDGRMTAAGYSFVAPWGWGENIAWRSFTGSSPGPPLLAQLHKDLFVDAGIADRGHRTNLMSPDFREIGSGFTSGTFKGWTAGMLTTDFAKTAGNPFLTGVAYQDTIADDDFYTPGEGLAGVTVVARRLADNALFSTTTFASGGYSLPLAAGTYDVSASGGPLAHSITFRSIVIGAQNVKTDFVAGATPPGDTTPPTATLTQALRNRSASRYYPFTVTYADDTAIDPETFDSYDVVVTGPGGYLRYANFDSVDSAGPGKSRVVNYVVKGPGGSWDAADNGVYTITLRRRQVYDAAGNAAASRELGAFSAIIPTAGARRALPVSAPATVAPFGIQTSTQRDEAPVFA